MSGASSSVYAANWTDAASAKRKKFYLASGDIQRLS